MQTTIIYADAYFFTFLNLVFFKFISNIDSDHIEI